MERKLCVNIEKPLILFNDASDSISESGTDVILYVELGSLPDVRVIFFRNIYLIVDQM